MSITGATIRLGNGLLKLQSTESETGNIDARSSAGSCTASSQWRFSVCVFLEGQLSLSSADYREAIIPFWKRQRQYFPAPTPGNN